MVRSMFIMSLTGSKPLSLTAMWELLELLVVSGDHISEESSG